MILATKIHLFVLCQRWSPDRTPIGWTVTCYYRNPLVGAALRFWFMKNPLFLLHPHSIWGQNVNVGSKPSSLTHRAPKSRVNRLRLQYVCQLHYIAVIGSLVPLRGLPSFNKHHAGWEIRSSAQDNLFLEQSRGCSPTNKMFVQGILAHQMQNESTTHSQKTEKDNNKTTIPNIRLSQTRIAIWIWPTAVDQYWSLLRTRPPLTLALRVLVETLVKSKRTWGTHQIGSGRSYILCIYIYIYMFKYTYYIYIYITYGPHKAVAEVSNHNEPIGRTSGIQLVRKSMDFTFNCFVLNWLTDKLTN